MLNLYNIKIVNVCKIIQSSTTENAKDNILCIENYDDRYIIQLSSNMAMLIVRNHQWVICNKVLENRAKTDIPFISTYNLV